MSLRGLCCPSAPQACETQQKASRRGVQELGDWRLRCLMRKRRSAQFGTLRGFIELG
jgi:hypothetical protein